MIDMAKARNMSTISYNVFLIDDNPDHARDLEQALTVSGNGRSNLECFATLSSGLDRLAHVKASAIFVNLCMPDCRPADTLERLLLVAPTVPIVVIGGADDEEICKTAMKSGAQDYHLEGHLDEYSFTRALRNIDERVVARRELFAEKERAQVTLN